MDQLMDQSFLSERPEISDFVIIIAGQRLKVHKSVLKSSSDYFSALFNSSMIETKRSEVILKETLLKPFMIVLSLAYDHPITDDQWLGFQIQEMFESIITSNKYQFFECERLLSHNLIHVFNYQLRESLRAVAGTPEDIDLYLSVPSIMGDIDIDDQLMPLTIWEVLERANGNGLTHLLDSCLKFMDENVGYTLKTLNKQYITGDIIMDVISRDTFVTHEYDICKIVKKWINNYGQRAGELMIGEVLKKVNLNLVSLDELLEVNKEGDCDSSNVDEATKHLGTPILDQNKLVCNEWCIDYDFEMNNYDFLHVHYDDDMDIDI